MPDRRLRALIADPDRATRLLLARHLRLDGFAIEESVDGRDALERVAAARFDLVVLDAALPGLDGIALCRAIRQGALNTQAGVFVIARSRAESDTVLAFANGADDYLTRPVSVPEFLARVSAVMRRVERTADAPGRRGLEHGGVRLDPARRQVIVRGQIVACSRQEFELLYALAASPGVVFSREALVARCWANGGARDARLVDPIVSRLRRKIERDRDAPRLILTVWGVGYKFAESIAEV